MGFRSELYEPSRIAWVCWDLIWPAVYLGALSSVASVIGRAFAPRYMSSRVPTFARLLPIIGLTTVGLPVISWGIHAIVVLILWSDVIFTGHGDSALFPAYFLMVPVSGLGAVAIDRLCATASLTPRAVGRFRDALILTTVSICWTFVVVVVAFRWDS